jgi:peptide chain release factor
MITPFLRINFTGLLRQSRPSRCLTPSTHHFFSTSINQAANSLPPRPTVPDDDLHHVFLKGSGPGGQKINKTNSAVQLTHLPTGLVVKSQATRSRSQNYKIARQILAEKIELMEKGDESRAAKKVERKSMQKRSREKKARRKYRALVEAKEGDVEENGGGDQKVDGTTVEDEAGDQVSGRGGMQQEDKKFLRQR